MITTFFKEIFTRRELLFALTAKELKTRYKSAVLGFLWAFLNPLLQMAVLSVVFTLIVRIQVRDYPLFLITGILAWSFFSSSLISGTDSLIGNRDLIKKAAFPRAILPLAAILFNLVNLLLSLAILLPVALFFAHSGPALLLFPLVVLLNFVLAAGIVLISSSLNIYYRDISFIMQALVLVWFYASPVIYPLSMVPERFIGIYSLNPMAGIISLYRFSLLGGVFPPAVSVIFSLVWAAVFLVFGIIIFKKREPLFADWI
jgi:ABC-2 type transport system permease protein